MFNFTNNWLTNQQIVASQILVNNWLDLPLHDTKFKCIKALDELETLEFDTMKHILESRLISALNTIEEEMQYL